MEIHGRDRHIRLDVVAHHNRAPGRERHRSGPLGGHARMPTEIVAEEKPFETAKQIVAHILLGDLD